MAKWKSFTVYKKRKRYTIVFVIKVFCCPPIITSIAPVIFVCCNIAFTAKNYLVPDLFDAQNPVCHLFRDFSCDPESLLVFLYKFTC